MAVTRRQGREWALQMLCQFEANPPADMDQAIDAFWRQQWDIAQELRTAEEAFPVPCGDVPVDAPELVAPAKMREFSEVRVRGVMSVRDDIDLRLKRFLDHWDMYRLGSVERNVLRMCAWELLNCPDVPKPVAINEAVDLAKYFSRSESGRIVNGVLDRLRRYLENPVPQPEPPPVDLAPGDAVPAEQPPRAVLTVARKSAKKPGARKPFGAAKKPGARKPFGAAKKPSGGKSIRKRASKTDS